ncbi:GNAT family N-acetyltransferase [Isoptericola chiayiensis]|uniref:GNAT family N-acetyltransferase n=2 Tax=Isoptericola chiayiensis TaxID=579446 RepID=A0ABP8YAN3_9MICO
MVPAMTGQPDVDIVQDLAGSRYEAHVRTGHGAAVAGVLRYVDQEHVRVVPSTVVMPAHRHQGIASALVRRMLDDAREQGVQVDPRCWYVVEWLDQHPEYADVRWQGPPSGTTMGR